MSHRLVLVVLQIIMLTGAVAAAAAPAKHPNLLLNRDEIEQVKAKIAKYPWAAAALAKTKEDALKDNALQQALYYTFTGDTSFADRARGSLLHQAQSDLEEIKNLDIDKDNHWGPWGSSWGGRAWTYDLVYETCSPEERALIERGLTAACNVMIKIDKHYTTTPNLIFNKHFNIGLVGYCLGNQEIIEWGLNDPGSFGPQRGGFYQVMNSMISDGYFWAEAPIYALHYDVSGMLALAEAARHYDGTDLYHYVSKKSGASIKSLIDGYLRMGYPLERTGIGKGSVRMATSGDGSTGYDPSGTMAETFLTDSMYYTCMELAYKRYQDPGYAWMLSLAPDRKHPGWEVRSPWAYTALTHGEPLPANPTPPPAPSGVYPGQGFAMIRADETPAYWTSGTLAAMVMLGKAIGHGHNDFYSLVLHGKGRLLYPDINVIQYEATYLNWTHEGIAHSTLLVDKQSPRSGPFTTLNDFTPEVKFFAVNGSAFDNVMQTRRLLLAKDYLVDVFHAADTKGTPRTFDWVLHGLGRMYPGNPTAYQPSDALLPYYWWIEDERSRHTGDTWQADWIQRTAGAIDGIHSGTGWNQTAMGKTWFQTEVGTRITMLGVKDTQVFYGDGPLTHGPPYGRIDGQPEPAAPLVLARRTGTAATFAALHEPYSGAPKLRRVSRVAETDSAIVLAAEMPDYTDYLCVAFDNRPHTLRAADGRAFTFSAYGFVRIGTRQPVLRGKLSAFRLPGEHIIGDRLLANGTSTALRREGNTVIYGELPPASAPAPVAQGTDSAAEQAAALQYWLLPNEVHLSALKATDAREVTLHLRSVGQGQVSGRLRITAPEGLSVEPASFEIPALGEGTERAVTLTVRKIGKVNKGLYPLAIVPEGSLRASPGTLLTSVGVVMTTDRRRPLNAQYVVRAPGYTTKVDQYSGVSFYLLDADGHRRYGRFFGNFATGFPSLEGVSQYRNPCGFIWPGEKGMTIGFNDAGVRMNYTFDEERIVYTISQPRDLTKRWTAWLGTFDTFDDPIHRSKPPDANNKGGAEWYFLPHPVFRQGLLITLAPHTELTYPKGYGYGVSFPLKYGDEIVLQFITPAEWEALILAAKQVPPNK